MFDVACRRPLRRKLRRDDGATAVEYAMMIALIAFVLMGALSLLGDNLSNTFSQLGGAIINSPASADDDGGGAEDGGGSGDNNGWGDGVGGGQDHNG